MSGGNKNGKAPSVALDWKVGGTKKGALPIRVEKRGHKTVTIVYNVVQRPDMLLYDLKRSIGTGGKLCGGGIIEIQGDQQKKIEAHLLDCPHKLQGIAGLGVRKQGKTGTGANADASEDEASGNRRRDKPRWDRRDKESERHFVAMRCGCNWIYCTGSDNCRAVASTSQVSGDTGESMMWGIDDDGDWLNARKTARTEPVQEMSDADLDNALSLFGLLSERATVDKKTTKSKHGGSTTSKHPCVAAPPRVHSRNTHDAFWQRPRDVSTSYGAVVRSSYRANRQPRRGAEESASTTSTQRSHRSGPRTGSSRGKRGRGSGRPGVGSQGSHSGNRRPRLGDVDSADPYYDDVAFADAVDGMHSSHDADGGRGQHHTHDAYGDAIYTTLHDYHAPTQDDVHETRTARPGRTDASGDLNFPNSDEALEHGNGYATAFATPDGAIGADGSPTVVMTQAYYERKFEAIIGDVLSDPTKFAWSVFFDSMGFGIPEDECFLAALEASLHTDDSGSSDSDSDYDDSDGSDYTAVGGDYNAVGGDDSANGAWGRDSGDGAYENTKHSDVLSEVPHSTGHGRHSSSALKTDATWSSNIQPPAHTHTREGWEGGDEYHAAVVGGIAPATPTVTPTFLRGGGGRGRGRGRGRGEASGVYGMPTSSTADATVPTVQPHTSRLPPGLTAPTTSTFAATTAWESGRQPWESVSDIPVAEHALTTVPGAFWGPINGFVSSDAVRASTPDAESLQSDHIRQLWSASEPSERTETQRHSSAVHNVSSRGVGVNTTTTSASSSSHQKAGATVVTDAGGAEHELSDEEGLWSIADDVIRRHASSPQQGAVRDADVATLLDMGFAYNRAVQCLGKVQGNVDMAMELLLANADGFDSSTDSDGDVSGQTNGHSGVAMKDSDYQLAVSTSHGKKKVRVPSEWRTDHAMLVDMGFDTHAALQALQAKGVGPPGGTVPSSFYENATLRF